MSDSQRANNSLDTANEKGIDRGTVNVMFVFFCLTCRQAKLEAIVLPEFDDPNIDEDAAIAGILGW
jgi:hypothetical protein